MVTHTGRHTVGEHCAAGEKLRQCGTRSHPIPSETLSETRVCVSAVDLWHGALETVRQQGAEANLICARLHHSGTDRRKKRKGQTNIVEARDNKKDNEAEK